MIRIEGISIVAARLAAMHKAAKAIEPSRPHRRQKGRVPMASTSARIRQSRANAQV